MINPGHLARRAYAYRASLFVYILIGGLSALINWIVFYVFYTYLPWHYGVAAVAAFLVATGANYTLSEKVGFVSGGRSRLKLVVGVYLVSVAGLGVDLLALAVLFEVFAIDIMVAKLIGTAAAFVVNFGGRQFFVFVRQPRWTSLRGLRRGSSGLVSPEKDELSASDDQSLPRSERRMESGI